MVLMQYDPGDVDDLRYSLLDFVSTLTRLTNRLSSRGTFDSSDSWKGMAEDHDVCLEVKIQPGSVDRDGLQI